MKAQAPNKLNISLVKHQLNEPTKSRPNREATRDHQITTRDSRIENQEQTFEQQVETKEPCAHKPTWLVNKAQQARCKDPMQQTTKASIELLVVDFH